MCALPLAYYKEHKDNIPWQSIHECKTITNCKEPPTSTGEIEAILNCKDLGYLEQDGFISFPHALEHAQGIPPVQFRAGATVKLPEVFFPKRSAEAMLEGKRPQLVLVVRAVHAHTGAPLPAIRPVASPPFHVATRRTRGNEKAYIPSMDQEVRQPSRRTPHCPLTPPPLELHPQPLRRARAAKHTTPGHLAARGCRYAFWSTSAMRASRS